MGSCCSTNNTPKDTTIEGLTLTAGPGQDDDAVTSCPVMAGTPVVKAVAEAIGLFRDYEGNRYWFCCAGCGPAFDAAPAKYAQRSDLSIPVIVTDPANIERQLNNAVDILKSKAQQESRRGILVTRLNHDSFTVALSDDVPFGLTREHRDK